jgi:ATP-binding cassette subfamily B protein
MSQQTQTLGTFQYYWRLIRYSVKYFITDISTAFVFWLSFTVIGLILRAFFNYLTGDEGFSLSLGPVVGLQLGYAVIASLALVGAILANTGFRNRSIALMIRNMFSRILDMPGSIPLPKNEDNRTMSSGEVISTFRDDTNEIVNAVTEVEDTIGLGITAMISMAIMISINPVIALGTFLPLGLIVFVAHKLGPLVKKYRKASREATSQVTGIIADMFNGTQALKVGHAEERIVTHFRGVNAQRQESMIRDRLLSEFVNALSNGTVDIGMGLILLLAASSMYAGEFTIGDFALFAAYLWPTTHFMRIFGALITLYKQTTISFERMEKMMQGAPAGGIMEFHPVYLRGDFPEVPYTPKTAAHQLDTLTVENLTYLYNSTENQSAGIRGVSFSLERGSFTVVTGKIGSGKTTLLKVILGLLPSQEGRIFWNGDLVEDPRSFFQPPRCAYTGQAPRLFSASVSENILLGLPEDQVNLSGSIAKAALERDVLDMEGGLNTLVGSKGIRLSGGQLQRTAAARMLVRDAELMILDDLSSALDVETERQLWEMVFHERNSQSFPTCLVVSHRRFVLQQADQIIVMKDGRIDDQGNLQELLLRSDEMNDLYAADQNPNHSR